MKKNKSFYLGLLILSTSMVLASCGGGASSATGGESTGEASTTTSQASESTTGGEASTGGDTSGESVTSGEELVTPTRVKITQQGTVAVGTVLTIADFCVFTPANANNYWLESADDTIAKPSEDNKTITVLAPGKTTVAIKVVTAAGKTSQLGKISITALSEEAIKIQQFADGITNRFAVTGRWYEFKKTWDKVTEDEVAANEDYDFLGLFVNPSYVLDWTYGAYSALYLEADENCYGYNLFDDDENELPGKDATDAMEEIAKATGVQLTERVDSNYLNLYFVIDQGALLDLVSWEEKTNDDGDTYFELIDGSKAESIIGTLFGMSINNYSGVGATLTFDEENEALNFEVRFDYKGSEAQRVVVSVVAGEKSDIPLLLDASKELNPPAAADVTEVVDAFASFDETFAASWEIGLFDRETMQPTTDMDDSYASNSTGVSLISGGTILNARIDRKADGSLDVENVDYSGIYTDTENGGIYSVEADEDGNVAKSKDTPISGSESIKDYKSARHGLGLFDTGSLTKSLIEGASLSLLDADKHTYEYKAPFDSLALGAVLSTFCPLGYTDQTSGDNIFATPDNANYCESYIVLDPENEALTFYLFERVRLDEAGTKTAYQGIIVTLSHTEFGEIGLGTNFPTVFHMDEVPEPEPEPEVSGGSISDSGDGE